MTLGWRAQLLVWLASFLVYAGYFQGQWTYGERPIYHITGDEPHYLVIATSILRDHDLDVFNNYRDKHYFPFYPYHLGDSRLPEDMHVLYGRGGRLYSKHSFGLPLLLLPAMAAGGAGAATVFMLGVAAVLSLQVLLLALRCTGRFWPACFAWVSIAFTPPLLLYAHQFYPEVPGALLAVAAVQLILEYSRVGTGGDVGGAGDAGRIGRVGHVELVGDTGRAGLRQVGPASELPFPGLTAARLFGTGVAIALLPWLHLRYIPIAAVLAAGALVPLVQAGALRSIRRFAGHLAAFTLPLVVSGLALLGLDWHLYGGIPAVGDYGDMALQHVLTGAPGILFDRQFGLIPYAPVYSMALAGLTLVVRSLGRAAGVTLLATIGSYALFVAFFNYWYGAFSPPARMIVPVVPLLVVPLALAIRRWTGWPFRALFAGLLTLSWSIAHLLMDVPRLRYNLPDGESQLLVYLTRVWGRDLTGVWPSYLDPTFGSYAWLAGFVVLAFTLYAAGRRIPRLGARRRAPRHDPLQMPAAVTARP